MTNDGHLLSHAGGSGVAKKNSETNDASKTR